MTSKAAASRHSFWSTSLPVMGAVILHFTVHMIWSSDLHWCVLCHWRSLMNSVAFLTQHTHYRRWHSCSQSSFSTLNTTSMVYTLCFFLILWPTCMLGGTTVCIPGLVPPFFRNTQPDVEAIIRTVGVYVYWHHNRMVMVWVYSIVNTEWNCFQTLLVIKVHFI
jgi:hypothetical protein